MSCSVITPSRLKTLRPQFAAVADGLVQGYIDTAQIWVSEGWPDKLCEPVQVALVCHMMTLDGMGTDPLSMSYAEGMSDYQTLRSGSVTITRFRDSAISAGLSTTDWFAQTPCGRQFLVFARMVFSGPRVAISVVGSGATGYSKDGWWSC